jgi:hypothetical protein
MGAGLCAGVAGLLIAWFAGGELGYYGSTGPLLWLTPLLFLGWMVLPSLVVFGWVAWSGRRVTESAGDFEFDDYEKTEDAAGSEGAPEEDVAEDEAEEEASEASDGSEGSDEEPTEDEGEDAAEEDTDDGSEDEEEPEANENGEDGEDGEDGAVGDGTGDNTGDGTDVADDDK